MMDLILGRIVVAWFMTGFAAFPLAMLVLPLVFRWFGCGLPGKAIEDRMR